jgi:hypothetical protein
VAEPNGDEAGVGHATTSTPPAPESRAPRRRQPSRAPRARRAASRAQRSGPSRHVQNQERKSPSQREGLGRIREASLSTQKPRADNACLGTAKGHGFRESRHVQNQERKAPPSGRGWGGSERPTSAHRSVATRGSACFPGERTIASKSPRTTAFTGP